MCKSLIVVGSILRADAIYITLEIDFFVEAGRHRAPLSKLRKPHHTATCEVEVQKNRFWALVIRL
jgi:hypothetical protein